MVLLPAIVLVPFEIEGRQLADVVEAAVVRLAAVADRNVGDSVEQEQVDRRGAQHRQEVAGVDPEGRADRDNQQADLLVEIAVAVEFLATAGEALLDQLAVVRRQFGGRAAVAADNRRTGRGFDATTALRAAESDRQHVHAIISRVWNRKIAVISPRNMSVVTA